MNFSGFEAGLPAFKIANPVMSIVSFICETKVKKKNQCCKGVYKLL